MKTSKVLLGSFVFAGLVSACTNEEIVEVAQNNATLAERTQVNLTFGNSVNSRMGISSDGTPVFTTNDVLGAVLVDNGYKADGWNYVDWTVNPKNGHVGNNKWSYDGNQFTTDGTTSVGAWLFYTKYNEAMTTSRDGVKYHLPQIQEGASNLAWVENNNINFKISPVLKIDGYEGENMDLELQYASIYNYLNLKFKFADPAVTSVQKVLVYVKKDGAKANIFADYRVKSSALPVANLSLSEQTGAPTVKDWNGDGELDLVDQNAEILDAYYKMRQRGRYTAAGFPVTTGGINQNLFADWNTAAAAHAAYEEKVGTDKYAFLVLDCDASHTDAASTNGGMAVTNGKFETYMLMPAGNYSSIKLEIYTNNGVYSKEVVDRNSYRENIADDVVGKPSQVGKDNIYLRYNVSTNLANVEGVNHTFGDVDYLLINSTPSSSNKYITKTTDLINFINGITTSGEHIVNVISQEQVGNPGEGSADDEAIPAHSVIINKAVMDAIVAKEAVKGDIQLVFKGAKMLVKGGADAQNTLNIHDLTFTEGADLVEGYAKATSEIVVPESPNDAELTVKGNSTLQLDMENAGYADLYQINVEAGSTLNVVSENEIKALVNKGNVAIGSSKNKVGSITTRFLTNYGTFRNFNELNVEYSFSNVKANSKFINGGEVTLVGTAKNNGTLENSNLVNVKGEFTNNATISNTKSGFIFVTATGSANGALNNGVDGVITNKGRIYTNTGNNTIQNLGVIEAKAGSTTYITTNSKLDEKVSGTNADTQVMGTIKIEKRNTDISVTEPLYQGYKEYAVAAEDLTDGILSAMKNDKFNKIVLSTEAELSAEVASSVNYVVTSSNITFPKGDRIQELEFTGNAEIYAEVPASQAERVVIGQLTVNEDLFVKLPTENALYVFGITSFANSATHAKIINNGEILVGGDMYVEIDQATAKSTSADDALFTSGHGISTAWHWAATW